MEMSRWMLSMMNMVGQDGVLSSVQSMSDPIILVKKQFGEILNLQFMMGLLDPWRLLMVGSRPKLVMRAILLTQSLSYMVLVSNSPQ